MKYYVKWILGAVALGIVIDSWSGSNALLKTGFSGSSGLITALKKNPNTGG